MLDVSFPDHVAQLPVNELAPAPPPPSPAIFEQAAASRIGALQRQLEQAQAAVKESKAAKEHADTRRAKAEADTAKSKKEAAAMGGTAADWTRLRAGFKQHWNGCVKVVELDPTAEPDVWSLDVVKRVLASANMEWMIRQLQGQIGKAPPDAPKFPKGCDAEAHVKANAAIFKGWERACTNYRLKVKKVLGVFLLQICVTSQRCNELAECIGLIMGPMNDKHRAVLHGAFGLASSKETNRRNVKARQGKYHQDLNARLLQIVQELIEAGGRGYLALGWDDDYTKIVFRRTIDAESRAKTEYFWTTIAFRMKAVPGAKMPRYDPTKPPFNVAGFSDETITEILDAACPGLDDGYLDHLDGLLKQPSNGGVGVAASEHKDGSPLSKTAMRERTRDADHGNAAEADNMAKMKEGTYYVDSLQQNFKSYLEFCRALIRLVSLPAAFKLLDSGFYLPCPEDWPAREFQEAVILQGWATKEELRRGPLHLGKLLHAACFHDTTGPAAPELWDLWLQTSGLSGEEAMLKLGNVARLVTVVTGPLHIYLNGCTDAYKFHENTFLRPFHRAWVGREWTDKPKVRTICAVLEVLYAGYVRIRPKVLEVLTALQAKEGNRADIAAFLHFFEEHVPLLICTCGYLLRENVKDGSPGAKDKSAYHFALKRLAVMSYVTQRKNYTGAFLQYLDDLRWWRLSGNELYDALYDYAGFFDESIGETGIHSYLRPRLHRGWHPRTAHGMRPVQPQVQV